MRRENKELLDDERGTSRLEAFSDGVMAVAITLLVFSLQVPEVKTNLLTALLQQWSSYLGYVTSFLLISIIWANHHTMFKYIQRTDHPFLLINALLLMVIVFIPFTTSLLEKYVNHPGEEHTAALVYSGTFLLLGIMFNLVWQYASAQHRLLREGLDPQVVRSLTSTYLMGPPLYLLSLLLSLVSVEASLVLYLLTALLFTVPTDRVRFRKPDRKAGGLPCRHTRSTVASRDSITMARHGEDAERSSGHDAAERLSAEAEQADLSER